MITVTHDPCMWDAGWRTRTVDDNVNGPTQPLSMKVLLEAYKETESSRPTSIV